MKKAKIKFSICIAIFSSLTFWSPIMIFSQVTPCDLNACDFICNGGMEAGADPSDFSNLTISLYDSMVSGWGPTASTPDFFHRSTEDTLFGIPKNFISKNSYTIDTNKNDRFIGMYSVGYVASTRTYYIEGVYTEFNKPLVPGTIYEFSFWVFSNKTNPSQYYNGQFKMKASLNTSAPVYTSDGQYGSYEAVMLPADSVYDENVWHEIKINYQTTDPNLKYLIIEPEPAGMMSDAYLFLDNVSFKEVGVNCDDLGPTAEITKPVNTRCTGDSILVSGSISEGTPLWTHSGKGSILDNNTLNATYISDLKDEETVYVYLTATNSEGKTGKDSALIQLVPIMKAQIQSPQDESKFCPGDTIIFQSRAKNYANYEWSHNGKGTLIETESFAPKYISSASENQSVTFTLIAYGNAPCTSASDSKTYSFSPLATASAGSQPDGSETLTQIQLTGANTNGTVSWSHNGKGSLSNDQSLSPIYNVDSGDSSIVIITLQSVGVCNTATSNISLNLKIENTPTAIIDPVTTPICAGTSIVLTGSSDIGTLEWTHNGKGTLLNPKTNSPTYVSALTDNSKVSITLTAQTSTSKSSTTQTDLNIISAPIANVPTKSYQIKKSQSVHLTGNTANGPIMWRVVSGKGSLSETKSPEPVYTSSPEDEGQAILTMTVYSECDSTSSEITIQIEEPPQTSSPNACVVKIDALQANYEENNINLSWKTLEEKNNGFFEVHRSSNQFGYKFIGKVQANTNNSPSEYNYVDNDIEEGKEYKYQIFQKCKNLDFSGTSSDIITVIAQGSTLGKTAFNVQDPYPNPSENGPIKINISLPSPGTVILTLFDLNGRKIAEESSDMPTGESTLIFEPENYNLKRGSYLYSVSYNLNSFTGKFVRLSTQENKDTEEEFDDDEFILKDDDFDLLYEDGGSKIPRAGSSYQNNPE